MGDALFPSGPWTGFYKYSSGGRGGMDLRLRFEGGLMDGSGRDPVGPFTVQGTYDERALECRWVKQYVGRHSVKYRGFREGKGIWGVWELHAGWTGGFHIWPVGADTEGKERSAEQEWAAEPDAGVELRRVR